MSRRVVLDTSALVSAALRIGSIPHQALLEAFGTCDVCASTEALTELEQVLDREKFDRYLNRALRREFIRLVRRNVHLYAIQDVNQEALEPSCRDPRDNHFLALAIAAEADVVVASDEDLLVLHPWHGIPILTPGEFLSQFGVSSQRKKDK